MRTNQVIELFSLVARSISHKKKRGGTIEKKPSLEECSFTITTQLKIDITTPKALLPSVKC